MKAIIILLLLSLSGCEAVVEVVATDAATGAVYVAGSGPRQKQTEPIRIHGLDIQDAGQNAYLWTTGYIGSWYEEDYAIVPHTATNHATITAHNAHPDYATITHINDVKVPVIYSCKFHGSVCFYTFLLEIPSGNHTVEIVYSEEDFYPNVNSRQTLSFTAKPNRTYVPFVTDAFVTDKCPKEFFWIEDWGLYEGWIPYIPPIKLYKDLPWPSFEKRSDWTKPVVAGKRPIKDSCAPNPNGSPPPHK